MTSDREGSKSKYKRPGELRWIPSPERYQKRICKVVVLVFSVELLRFSGCNNHLFLLCFSLSIPEDPREEQTPGWQKAALCNKKRNAWIINVVSLGDREGKVCCFIAAFPRRHGESETRRAAGLLISLKAVFSQSKVIGSECSERTLALFMRYHFAQKTYEIIAFSDKKWLRPRGRGRLHKIVLGNSDPGLVGSQNLLIPINPDPFCDWAMNKRQRETAIYLTLFICKRHKAMDYW